LNGTSSSMVRIFLTNTKNRTKYKNK
jgi:hypothetical protein